jgi:hypothetical protein
VAQFPPGRLAFALLQFRLRLVRIRIIERRLHFRQFFAWFLVGWFFVWNVRVVQRIFRIVTLVNRQLIADGVFVRRVVGVERFEPDRFQHSG